MLLWLLLAAMTGLAAFTLLWPLARIAAVAPAVAPAPDDAAFYRAALADIDHDRARGLIGEREADAARTEAARRLLRSEAESHPGVTGVSSLRRRKTAAVIALVVVPALALPAYLATGSPQLPDQPLAARKAVDPSAISVAEAVARIEAHLARNPDDGAGYDMLAPVYLKMGRAADAARAYSAALRLNGETPERLAGLGEALVTVAEGVVTAEAQDLFTRASAAGFNPRASFYLALAREQDGDREGAAQAFEKLIAASPADAPWLPAAREKLGALRGAPAGGEAVAALPESERDAAIRGMVARLAERLATNGGSVAEWSRLIRSHMVLGEKEKAAQALAEARKALGADATQPLDALSRELRL